MGGRGAKGLGKTIRKSNKTEFLAYNADGSLTNDAISRLEAKGAKRWQKNGMDRIYINPSSVGLHYENNKPYLTLVNGETNEISNRMDRMYHNTKLWIDTKTGELNFRGDKRMLGIAQSYINKWLKE